jgi:hypothetical protein
MPVALFKGMLSRAENKIGRLNGHHEPHPNLFIEVRLRGISSLQEQSSLVCALHKQRSITRIDFGSVLV